MRLESGFRVLEQRNIWHVRLLVKRVAQSEAQSLLASIASYPTTPLSNYFPTSFDMDILPSEPFSDTVLPESSLSYDDSVPYSELPPVPEPGHSSLADRIGQTKVYLISDAVAARTGKVRRWPILQSRGQRPNKSVILPLCYHVVLPMPPSRHLLLLLRTWTCHSESMKTRISKRIWRKVCADMSYMLCP